MGAGVDTLVLGVVSLFFSAAFDVESSAAGRLGASSRSLISGPLGELMTARVRLVIMKAAAKYEVTLPRTVAAELPEATF